MRYYFIFFFTLFVTLSCSSKRSIVYLQNDLQEFSNNYDEYKIAIDDILKIDVEVQDPDINIVLKNNSNSAIASSKDSFLYNGYQVNTDGKIHYPGFQGIYVRGLSINELRDKLKNLFTENGIFINPSIDIKLLNAHFTILGEVSRPGRYDFTKNNMNILEALGMAGDLTITGNRKNIKLIREIDGNKFIYGFDLTDSNILNSQNYQILSRDIIIVNPNSTRIKNAGIIGNSGTLLSLLSFILSSIIVINS